MQWGMDPARVAELKAIAEARRFSVRETERFVLAITGTAQADMPLWDLLVILFALGHLAATPRMAPRDASIACMLDEGGHCFAPLRRAVHQPRSVLGATIAAGPASLDITFADAAGDAQGSSRSYAWSRVRLCLALGEVISMAQLPDTLVGGTPRDGMTVVAEALSQIFEAPRFGHALLKQAIKGPARFMRGWRQAYLPLQAYAELVRAREAWLALVGRGHATRTLDSDDVLALWRFTRQRGATWTYARFLEKLSSLLREERMQAARRGFMAAGSLDDLSDAALGSTQPDLDEAALLATLDGTGEAEAVEPAAGPAGQSGDGEPPLLAEEPALLALLALPAEPKLLTGEQRARLAATLCLLPLAAELPLTLLRANASRNWENRLVEASRRRGATGVRAAVDTAPPTFDYAGELVALSVQETQTTQLVDIAELLTQAMPSGPRHDAAAAHLQKLQRDRASLRLPLAELALILARHHGGLLLVRRAMNRIHRSAQAFGVRHDLQAQALADQHWFSLVLAEPVRTFRKPPEDEQ
jgi:hypothetical protein